MASIVFELRAGSVTSTSLFIRSSRNTSTKEELMLFKKEMNHVRYNINAIPADNASLASNIERAKALLGRSMTIEIENGEEWATIMKTLRKILIAMAESCSYRNN